MSGLMSPHFVPINNPHTYVTMYERLVQILQQQNPDLVFMLLTKVSIVNLTNSVTGRIVKEVSECNELCILLSFIFSDVPTLELPILWYSLYFHYKEFMKLLLKWMESKTFRALFIIRFDDCVISVWDWSLATDQVPLPYRSKEVCGHTGYRPVQLWHWSW